MRIDTGSRTIVIASRLRLPTHLLLSVAAMVLVGSNPRQTRVAAQQPLLIVSASFTGKQFVKPDERIELLLNRALNDAVERTAVLIGMTDVSGLFVLDGLRLRYNASVWPLPLGQSLVTVYLVSVDNEWKEIARFALRVEKKSDSEPQRTQRFSQRNAKEW